MVLTTTLRSDPDLGYRIRILLYDLRNLQRDQAAGRRIHSTTDELYLSAPYFTPEEVARIKNAVVDTVPRHNGKHQTVDQLIRTALAAYWDKRRAGADMRPCGPHDLSPIYESVFGISKEELQDEQFLLRLRRQGLERPGNTKDAEPTKGRGNGGY